MKKFFKYLFIIIGFIILATVIGVFTWWSLKSDSEKSMFFTKYHNYQKAVEYDPNNSDAWMELSVAYNKAGDFEKGFEFLNKAVALNPELHLGYRGWIHLRKLRNYNKALEDFNKLDSLTPNFVDAPWGEDIDFLKGECYYGKKEYETAIATFNKNINNHREDLVDVQTFVYLGLCEFKLGNYKKAILEFERGLNQYENICEAYFGLAKAHTKLENYKKASEYILKAEEIIHYKRDDYYNEFLNEIYLSEILELKHQLGRY